MNRSTVDDSNESFLSNQKLTVDTKSNYCDNFHSSNYVNPEVANEQISSLLRKRIQYYKEENEKFGTLLNQIELNDTESCSPLDWDTAKILSELCDIQELFGIDELSASAICMAEASHFNEDKSNYLAKLKGTTKLYMDLNEKLCKKITVLSSELQESKIHIDKMFELSNEDIFVLEKKVAAYEIELSKFEKKHPWLKDPKFDLAFISKEAQILSNLLEERNDLEKDLNVYQGLKPDLKEATQQLNLVKKRYEELKNKFHNSR